MLKTRVASAALGLAVLCATATLAGCGARVPDALEGTRPTAVAVASLDHCPSRPSEVPRSDGFGGLVGSGVLPADFRPVRVVRCRWVSDTATRVVIEEDRTSSVTPAFLASLELPDQVANPDSHAACAAVATSLSYLVLVDAEGRAVVPHLPEEPCGAPRAEIERAVHDLGLTLARTYRFDDPV
ncbi:hypothetical protein SAMN04488544_2313 [Microlunatus sagamiharensis]|uniref:DUF3558 domain-containing protein n=1 Tax=Microlunatus sagamiharensis TaxID=546874 RepID=A0A1H2MM44_9ACTN|nr:hypothetical protein [Microlunatus sagamiharensis]SDU94134.1 hypothetical protein SAMN04488544_2313 [Microlunatus sagamiharensis]